MPLERYVPLLLCYAKVLVVVLLICSLARELIAPESPELAASSAQPSGMMTDALSDDLIAVYVTVPDMETGKKIGGNLVSNKMAACVNVIPGLTSIYSWEGKVNEDAELLLMIKTRKAQLEALTAAINSLHPYDVCEIIAVPIVGGSEPYMKWVVESTT